MSEIFSTQKQKQPENKSNASSLHLSPAKAAAPKSTAGSKNPENAPHPQYPDLTQNLNSFPQYNTDSGYHGLPDDDMVLPDAEPESQPSTQPLENQPTEPDHAQRSPADPRTDDSFHSAQENIRQRGATVEPTNTDAMPNPVVEVQIPKAAEEEPEPDIKDKPVDPEPESSPQRAGPVQDPVTEEKPSQEPPVRPANFQGSDANTKPLDNLDIGSPSEESSPDRPLVRKSSLTFASLPAREPLTKKSLGGARISRTSHVDVGKAAGSGYLGRQTGGKTTQALEENTQDEMAVDGEADDLDAEARASRLHSKSSTQRLHEKISMLGKSQPSRPTKSIPRASGAQVAYPELPPAKDAKPETSPKTQEAAEPMDVDTEEWIKPLSARPGLRKSQSIDVMELDQPDERAGNQEANNQVSKIDARPASAHNFSPRPGHQKSASTSNFAESTTPVGSPERQDGPLSASKLRLQSIMKSAKGLFSSSGGASAAARMGTSSPDEPRIARNRANTHAAGQERQRTRPSSPAKPEGRRTRSSTEREERRKQQELENRLREEELKVREQKQKIQMKASAEPETRPASPKRLPRLQKQAPKDAESGQLGASQAKPADRRPVKPPREPAQKPKPQPVSIRVGSALSRQMPLASSSLSSSVQETNPPAPATKQPTIKKKASNSSLHTAPSNSSFKSTASNQTQRKAQLASERKKEQEEQEARRKEEQKREAERKRATQQQEEARRQERSRAEAERRERERAAEDSKKAQMQAIEKRRLENARRVDRQGSQPPEMVSDAAPAITMLITQDTQPAQPRPGSRLGSTHPFSRTINQPQPNPAKPPKRAMEEEASRPTRKPSATIQPSGEAKRRKTEDEQNPAVVRPTMAPPIRQSNIRKVGPLDSGTTWLANQEPTKPSVFGSQAGPSMKAGQPQRAHPMDMAKYTSGKIPFAEPSSQPTHKTPGSSKAPARPSPKYPNGENIALPEIATDSEDEDSDAEMMPVPKWAQPKELESLLRQQEGMEVDSIFGPIAPFSLEETFKSDKKIKKFRERTSSANWSGADGLTQEEIRRDLSERQRMKMNGGWSFN